VKHYGVRTVVNGISISARCGEIVGLLGPNGAGKTTTFYMLVGLVKPNEGVVTFRGVNITRTPVFRRARMGIGYLAQEASIFRKLTVEENVLAILETLPKSCWEALAC
jgi:lipopolysaccharide export system ATP-binding protein